MGTSTEEPEKENGEETGPLIEILIKRCNHISDSVRPPGKCHAGKFIQVSRMQILRMK